MYRKKLKKQLQKKCIVQKKTKELIIEKMYRKCIEKTKEAIIEKMYRKKLKN